MDASNFSVDDLAKWLKVGKGGPEQSGWNWERTARAFGTSYVSLGLLAIILNGIFLYTLLARRRRTFSQAFYIIILNFILIDTIKDI
uniref:G_PROTEIN_RECEP_F1_2 domain-containing protein n=1 Tax=Heterorhabditis bacteriophora TaxID=37862 RepID=A0A1I7XNJ0_HETBA